MRPRPYQLDAIQQAYEHFRRATSALLVMATGTGKTYTAACIIFAAMTKKARVLWIAHRDELIRQPHRTLTGDKAPERWREEATGRTGFVKARENEAAAQVVYASVDTLRVRSTAAKCSACGRVEKRPPPLCECGAASWSVQTYMPRLEEVLRHGPIGLLVVDEAHHSAAEGQQRVIRRVIQHAIETASPGATTGLDLAVTTPVQLLAVGAEHGNPIKLLGLTATPERQDSLRLTDTWGEEPAFFFPIERAIQEGFLLRPIFDRQPLRLDRSKFDQMDDKEAAKNLVDAGAIDHCVASMQRYQGERTAIVFVPSVDMARDLCAALKDAGWRSSWICGDTDRSDRARIIRRCGAGELDCIVNVGVLTEGTDIPRVNLVVLLRPCRSKPLYIQIVGRGLRPFEDQADAVILCLTGASLEHSLTQAPVIVEPEPLEPEEDPESVEFRPPNRRAALQELGGLASIGKREPIKPAWANVLQVEGEWLACDCGGDMGLVLVGPYMDGWGAWWHKKRRRKQPLQLHEDGHPVGFIQAQQLGEDVFRRACPSADRRATQREEAPTPKQRKAVHFGDIQIRARNDWGQWVWWPPGKVPPRATRGDVEDAITARWAKEVLVRHHLTGLAERPNSKGAA